MRNQPHKLTAIAIAIAATACLAIGGCSASRDPAEAERLFGDAETLRLEYRQVSGATATAHYREAMYIWVRAGDDVSASRAGEHMGDTYLQLGAVRDALESYREALSHAVASGDRALESRTRSSVGRTLSLLGEHDAAATECASAYDLATRFGSDRERAAALNCEGESRYNRSFYGEALGSYERAAELWQQVDDAEGLAESRFFMGSAQSDLNDFAAATRNLELARSSWSSRGNRLGEARAIAARARLQLLQGEFQAALEDYDMARRQLEAIGDLYWQAICHMGIALVFYQTGELDNTLAELNTAARLHEAAGVQFGVIDAAMAIGLTHLALNQPDEAAARLEDALRLSQEAGNRLYEADSLRYLGQTEQARGNPAGALRHLQRSLEIQQSLEADPRLEAELRNDIAMSHEALGNYAAALRDFTVATTLGHELQDRLGEANGRFNLARINVHQGDLGPAQANVEAALDIAESLRTEVASQDLRSSFLASVHSYYELYVAVLMQLHERQPASGFGAQAFEVSERARARSLLESLGDASVDLRAGGEPLLLQRETELREALNAAYERQFTLAGTPNSEIETATLAREIVQLETQFDLVRSQIRSRSPLYAGLTNPEPLSLRAVQRDVLDDDTVLLEYAMGEETSFLWAVSKDTQASFMLPPRSEVEQAARDVYLALTARLPLPGEGTRAYQLRVRDAASGFETTAGRLSAMLLAPAAEMLAEYGRVLVVSDGALQYVPFGVLPDPADATQPMLTRYEVVSAPSASAVELLRTAAKDRARPADAIAVFADPVYQPDDERFDAEASAAAAAGAGAGVTLGDNAALVNSLRAALRTPEGELLLGRLHQTAREATAIAELAGNSGVRTLTGFDASRFEAMRSEIGNYRIIHFATHAVFNNDSPGLSGLVLSTFDRQGQRQDGFLRLHDIYNLKLPAELVVLSACNTALGAQIRGEGLVGIVRGFMYAGSKRVVASLWKVDDAATGELMKRFYEHMLTEGRSPADALRQAQLSMLAEPQWADPFYWAGFVLQGEWRGF